MKNTTQSTGIIEWRVLGSLTQPTGASLIVNNLNTNIKPDVSDKKEEGIALFPNPAVSSFRVDVNGYKPEDQVTMKIYDLQGKALLTKDLQHTRTISLYTSMFANNSNMYIITTSNGSKIFTKKLMVVR